MSPLGARQPLKIELEVGTHLPSRYFDFRGVIGEIQLRVPLEHYSERRTTMIQLSCQLYPSTPLKIHSAPHVCRAIAHARAGPALRPGMALTFSRVR